MVSNHPWFVCAPLCLRGSKLASCSKLRSARSSTPTCFFVAGVDAWSIHKGSCGYGWLDKSVMTGKRVDSTIAGHSRDSSLVWYRPCPAILHFEIIFVEQSHNQQQRNSCSLCRPRSRRPAVAARTNHKTCLSWTCRPRCRSNQVSMLVAVVPRSCRAIISIAAWSAPLQCSLHARPQPTLSLWSEYAVTGPKTTLAAVASARRSDASPWALRTATGSGWTARRCATAAARRW